jgi:hypothetical protein
MRRKNSSSTSPSIWNRVFIYALPALKFPKHCKSQLFGRGLWIDARGRWHIGAKLGAGLLA